jgi:hypothetical protein
VYEFTSSDDYALWQPNNENLSAKQRFAPWAYGLIKKVTSIGADGKKVKETENSYDFKILPIVGVFLPPYYPIPFPGLYPLVSCKCNVKTISSQRNDDWRKPEFYNEIQKNSDQNMGVEPYWHFTGRTELIQSKDRIYKKGDDSQYEETVTDYTYDTSTEVLESNFEVASIATTLSDGTVKGKKIKYTKNVKGGTIDVMNLNNMVSVPVSTVEYVDNGSGKLLIHETVSEFTQAPNGDIKVMRILQQRTDRPKAVGWNDYTGPATTDYNNYVVSQSFKYDIDGNAVTAIDEAGRTVADLYDYNDKYVVASVINADATTDKLAYTSFETNSPGGWQLSATKILDVNNAVTGTASLNLAGNSCSASLNTAKSYILSFWANNSNVIVSGGATLLKSAPIINSFTYYEYSIATGAGTVTLTGNALIDELRLYPANARMRTVSFDPLIGKIAECDENNRITYYEYDNLARLKVVRDEKRNIIKTYEYNNVNNQSGCPGIYYNNQLIEYFTKSGCGSGYVGTDEPFTVPANKYSSTISQEDADAKAEQEALTQGPINANNTGGCKILYSNAGRYQDFETENCAEGYYGGMVRYTVPAGKYTSLIPGEVEQMELDEIAANGQAHANDPAYANCILDTDPVYEWNDNSPAYCYNVNGQLPAHKFVQAIDVNPNSPTFNSNQWVDAGPSDLCAPNLYYSTDQSGDYYSENCGNGFTPLPRYVSMPNGARTSTVSVQDANDKARWDAQLEANLYGQCEYPPLYISCYFDRWDGEIRFSHRETGELTVIYVYAGSFDFYLPAGTYDIDFRGLEYYTWHYQAGCNGVGDDEQYGWGSLQYVEINSNCSTINITRLD